MSSQRPAIDYDGARAFLEDVFAQAESDLLAGAPVTVSTDVADACDALFRSRTQAYREVLLGCAIARIQNKRINIAQPYVQHGPDAFSGRTLDEKVVNPFLHDKRIPSSRGPYLSVFRRSVQFDAGTREGVRDKAGYDALLRLVSHLQFVSDEEELLRFLRYLLYRFAEWRESSIIPLSRLQRISLEQYEELISGLLATPSGGRLPVLLVVATFMAIRERFQLDWGINWQPINVADRPSGVGGDITAC